MANLTNEIRSSVPTSGASVVVVGMKLEVVVIPVSDVDRAKEFYGRLGWCLGEADANGPVWYSEYMVREQTGEWLPQ